MTKKAKYVKQLKTRKKGFNRLVESCSSSITISAKKYIKNEKVVKKRRLGI